MLKLIQKLNDSFSARVIAYIAAAVIVNFALCAILIAIGYCSLASSSALSYQVTLFGLSIYEIVKSGNVLMGHAVGANMPLIGIVSAHVLMFVTELILAIRRKKQNN